MGEAVLGGGFCRRCDYPELLENAPRKWRNRHFERSLLLGLAISRTLVEYYRRMRLQHGELSESRRCQDTFHRA